MTWAAHILKFIHSLEINERLLPEGIEPLYPFKSEHKEVISRITDAFYRKYYADNDPRTFIIGINPGRLGAGATSIPFTDPKRLETYCGIKVPEFSLHEPSSVFIYEVINAFGGPDKFYQQFYITSTCPVGFIKKTGGNKGVNFNYYDSRKFEKALTPYIVEAIETQLAFGKVSSRAICLGTGKNYKFLDELNQRQGYFDELIPIAHPRYVMQYKSRQKEEYIDKFLRALVS